MAEPTGSGSGVLQPPGPAADTGRAKPRGGRTTLDNVFNWVFNVTDKASTTLRKISNAFKATEGEVTSTAKRFKDAVSAASSGIMFSAGAAVGALSGLFDKFSGIASTAISNTVEYEKLFLGLGQTMYDSKEGLSGAYKEMGKLTFYMGTSIEKAKEMVELGRDLGLTGAKQTEWAKATIVHAKATGQSEAAVGKLFYRMTRLYGLGSNQLRYMGNAMSFVASQTNMSHDELTSYVESLEKFMRRLPNQGKEMRVNMTADMAAVAGAMKENFGDPAKIAEIMGTVLDRYKGRPIAAMMSRVIGGQFNAEEIIKNMKEDPGKIWMALAKSMGQKSPEEIERMMPFYEQMGFSYEDMLAFHNMSKNATKDGMSLEKFMEKAREKAKSDKNDREAAAKQVAWYELQMQSFRMQMMKFWTLIGKPIMAFITGAIKPLMEQLESTFGFLEEKTGGAEKWFEDAGRSFGIWVADKIKQFSTWLEKNWPEIIKWVETAGNTAKTVFDLLGKAVGFLIDNFGTLVKIWAGVKVATFMGNMTALAGGPGNTGILGTILGKVGEIGRAFAVGWTIGTLLDELLGISPELEKLLELGKHANKTKNTQAMYRQYNEEMQKRSGKGQTGQLFSEYYGEGSMATWGAGDKVFREYMKSMEDYIYNKTASREDMMASHKNWQGLIDSGEIIMSQLTEQNRFQAAYNKTLLNMASGVSAPSVLEGISKTMAFGRDLDWVFGKESKKPDIIPALRVPVQAPYNTRADQFAQNQYQPTFRFDESAGKLADSSGMMNKASTNLVEATEDLKTALKSGKSLKPQAAIP